MSTALICLLPGLGDALVAGPIMRGLTDSGYRVDALTMLAPVTEYARSIKRFEHVIELRLLQSPARCIGPLLQLRKERYDLVVLPFPATRWQYAFVAYVIHGKSTIMHHYGGLSSVLAKLVGAAEIPLRGGHRAYENARLAKAAGVERISVQYLMPPNWQRSPLPGVLGIHPGTMRYKGNEARRWPLERFVRIALAQCSKSRQVRIFLGPNEEEDREILQRALQNVSVTLVSERLDAAAAIASECEVLLANDSGFAHVAAGLGVKTLTLFGMTDPSRAAPIGNSAAFRPTACSPCHDEGMRRFTCVKNIDYACMNSDLTVEQVDAALDVLFDSAPSPYVPKITGTFRLYGKSITPQHTSA